MKPEVDPASGAVKLARLPPARYCAEALALIVFVPALIVGIDSLSLTAGGIAAAVALGHSLLLGLPAYSLLRSMGWANGSTATLMGFVVGALPVAIMFHPMWYTDAGTSTWSGNVPTMVQGKMTAQGWREYIEFVMIFAGFGALCGLIFWLYLKVRMRKRQDIVLKDRSPAD